MSRGASFLVDGRAGAWGILGGSCRKPGESDFGENKGANRCLLFQPTSCCFDESIFGVRGLGMNQGIRGSELKASAFTVNGRNPTCEKPCNGSLVPKDWFQA